MYTKQMLRVVGYHYYLGSFCINIEINPNLRLLFESYIPKVWDLFKST